jgi:hypothetical protein
MPGFDPYGLGANPSEAAIPSAECGMQSAEWERAGP